jgi:hypothetical protein
MKKLKAYWAGVKRENKIILAVATFAVLLNI